MREHVLALLGKYLPGRSLRPSGGSNYLTTCPFHKGGQEKKPSFSVNVDKGVFHCFTCHESGSLKYMLHLLSVPRDRIDSELQVIGPMLEKQKELYEMSQTHVFGSKGDPFEAPFVLPETLLGVFDHAPQPLIDDGFSPELLKKLDVGIDKVNQRITWPLRDMYGNLYGFSGGSLVKGVFPKYKVYQGRRLSADGKTPIPSDFGDWFDERFPGYVCENHKVLWNFDKVWPMLSSMSDPWCIIVEGFKAASWVMQSGFPNTVALMGSYISQLQQLMIHRLGGTVYLWLDNDKPGRDATLNVGDLLWKPMYGRIKVVQYPMEDLMGSVHRGEHSQPDDYERDVVQELISRAIPFTQHFNEMRRMSL
jgi:DNA primase